MNTPVTVAADNMSERRLGTIGNEDCWAVIVGLTAVIFGLIDYPLGAGVMKFLAVSPAGMKWASGGDVVAHFAKLWPNYIAQLLVLTGVFGGSLRLRGRAFGSFVPSFVLLYLGVLIVSILAGWKDANYYNLEAALLALIGGLAVANIVKIPERLKTALRMEFYVKTGIVLLGATFPISLIGVGRWRGLDAISHHLDPHRRYHLSHGYSSFRPRSSLCCCSRNRRVGVRCLRLARHRRLCRSPQRRRRGGGDVGCRRRDHHGLLSTLCPSLARFAGRRWGRLDWFVGIRRRGRLCGRKRFRESVRQRSRFATGFHVNKVIGRDIWIGVWLLFWAFVAIRYWKEATMPAGLIPAKCGVAFQNS